MAYASIFSDQEDLRRKNYATVEKYVSTKGQDRANRWMLYTEDCNTGLGYTPDCGQICNNGIENQKRMEAMNAVDFPDWSFWNNAIFQTEDPNYFIVEGEGGGVRKTPGRDDYYHGDHYFHTFRMVDGKIQQYREYMNPLKEQRDMGRKLNLPEIQALSGLSQDKVDLIQAEPMERDRNDTTLREKNLATIRAYLSMKGADRANRWTFYCNDCITGLGYTASGAPMKNYGIEAQKKMEVINARDFPDWEFTNNVIFQTADPNYFIVEGDGAGICLFNPEHPYMHSDHYIHTFAMCDGKIKMYHEYMNPCKELKDMGWDLGLPPMGPPPGVEKP